MNYGRSLCILCEKLLAEATLIAHPCDCPTHHFHCECLVKHARQNRDCPIDQIAFESIICENGLPITFPKLERPPSRKANPEAALEKKQPAEKREVSNQDVPGQARRTSENRREEAAFNNDNMAKTCGSRITIGSVGPNSSALGELANSALSDVSAALASALQDSGNLMTCVLCGKTIEFSQMASPNCCMHWFHFTCLDSYTDKSDICPFEGCYREIESFHTSAGDNYGLRIPETRDYRNMLNAPDNFVCSVCDQVDLHKNRATVKPCGHIQHRSCLIEYVREHKRCPVCKDETSAIECDTVGLLFFP